MRPPRPRREAVGDQVGAQIEGDSGQPEDHREALHHRNIPFGDSIHQHRSEPGDHIQRLHDDDPAQQPVDRAGKLLGGRRDGVGQRVHVTDADAGDAVAAGLGDVRRGQRIDHARPYQARQRTYRPRQQDENGDHQRRGVGEQVGAVADGGRRQPAEAQGEHGDQQHAEGELRDRVHAQRHRTDEPVHETPLVAGGQHTEADPGGHQQHHREHGEQHGRPEAVRDVRADGPPRRQGRAEVAVQQPGRPVRQAFVRRPVQMHRLADGRDPLRVGLVAGERHCGVARQRLGEGEDEQHDGCRLRHAEQQPPGDPGPESDHASQTLSKRAQSRELAGAFCSTPRTLLAVPRIQSAKPQIRKPPSVCRRRCMRS